MTAASATTPSFPWRSRRRRPRTAPQAAATGLDARAAGVPGGGVTAAEAVSEAAAAEPSTKAATVDVARPVAGDQATGSDAADGAAAESGADTAGADEAAPAADKLASSKQKATRGGRAGR